MTIVGAEAVTRAEPAYRVFAVSVSRVQRLGPSFIRLTFTGPDIGAFGTDGLDQRIKIALPTVTGHQPSAADFHGGDWYSAWRNLPDDLRCPLRTYTVRATRPEVGLGEVDVDFVLHADDHPGPAGRWLSTVAVGSPCVIIGPNGRYVGPPSGVEWAPPASASTFVLAGDETAAPAICSILESLPPGTEAHAFVEVPEQGDALPLNLPDGAHITWLPRSRNGHKPVAHGSLLDNAVRAHLRRCAATHVAGRCGVSCGNVPVVGIRSVGTGPSNDLEDIDVDQSILWEVPSADGTDAPTMSDCYAWIAGEAGVIKALRRHLVSERGLDRRSVAFMGYWRQGQAEG